MKNVAPEDFDSENEGHMRFPGPAHPTDLADWDNPPTQLTSCQSNRLTNRPTDPSTDRPLAIEMQCRLSRRLRCAMWPTASKEWGQPSRSSGGKISDMTSATDKGQEERQGRKDFVIGSPMRDFPPCEVLRPWGGRRKGSSCALVSPPLRRSQTGE